jgi:uncharacterized membrane protein YdjX (TVP38/TMEM64 family)
MRRRYRAAVKWQRLAAAAALAALAVVAVVVARRLDVPELRHTVEGAGVWAPLMFVALQVLCTVPPPIPRSLFTLAAGLLFGSATGSVLAVVATTLAAVAAFALVRLTGGGIVERYAERAPVLWTRRRLDRSGLLAVVSLRLIPVLPFPLVNYAAGLSGVGFLPYAAGTLLGILPGTIALVVLGDAVTGQVPTALLVVSVTCGLLGMAGIGVAARPPDPAAPDER